MKPATTLWLAAIAGGIALLFLMSSGNPSAREAIEWRTWDTGVAEAKTSGKPLFVDFGASWCGVCSQLDRQTLSDAKVAAALAADWVTIRVDVDREPARAQKYEIDGLPTLILLAADGTEKSRYRGFLTAKNLTDWLATNRPTI